MRIALDYDDTFTRDPMFWNIVIDLAKQRGHEIVCVTMRCPEDETPGLNIRTIYTEGRAKRPHTDNLGEQFHVWIDDSPEFIVYDARIVE